MCAQRRLRSAWASRPVWSVFAVRMKKAWVLIYPLSAQRRLISLGGCPGWSESSLGAKSFYWFCHEAAQMLNSYKYGHCGSRNLSVSCPRWLRVKTDDPVWSSFKKSPGQIFWTRVLPFRIFIVMQVPLVVFLVSRLMSTPAGYDKPPLTVIVW